MPSITTVHESLPYIDRDPTPTERSAAEALISSERALVPDDPFHALLPPPLRPSTTLTPLLTGELARAASGQKLAAIDFSRYEALSDDEIASLTKTKAENASADELTAALARAYTSHSYVQSRRAHLALLDAYGKNAWLVGNWQLEGELKRLERELAETKTELDLVTIRRREAQENVKAEMESLEETWRKGIGRVLETEAAAEEVRRQVDEVRRQMAA